MKLAELFNENKYVLKERLEGFCFPEKEKEVEEITVSFFEEIYSSNDDVKKELTDKFEPLMTPVLNLLRIKLQLTGASLISFSFSEKPKINNIFKGLAMTSIQIDKDWMKSYPADGINPGVTEFLEILRQLCVSIDQLESVFASFDERRYPDEEIIGQIFQPVNLN